MLRQEAVRGDIGNSAGILNVARPGAYWVLGSWAKLHPEAFASMSVQSDMGRAILIPAPSPMLMLPVWVVSLRGIPGGLPAYRAYTGQWGGLSNATGMEPLRSAIPFEFRSHIRCAGPWGSAAPSAKVIGDATLSGVSP